MYCICRHGWFQTMGCYATTHHVWQLGEVISSQWQTVQEVRAYALFILTLIEEFIYLKSPLPDSYIKQIITYFLLHSSFKSRSRVWAGVRSGIQCLEAQEEWNVCDCGAIEIWCRSIEHSHGEEWEELDDISFENMWCETTDTIVETCLV